MFRGLLINSKGAKTLSPKRFLLSFIAISIFYVIIVISIRNRSIVYYVLLYKPG